MGFWRGRITKTFSCLACVVATNANSYIATIQNLLFHDFLDVFVFVCFVLEVFSSSGQPAQLRPASPAQASQPSPRGPGCSPMSIYQSEVWSIGSCRKSMHCQKTRAPRPSAMIYTYIYIYIYIYIYLFFCCS